MERGMESRMHPPEGADMGPAGPKHRPTDGELAQSGLGKVVVSERGMASPQAARSGANGVLGTREAATPEGAAASHPAPASTVLRHPANGVYFSCGRSPCIRRRRVGPGLRRSRPTVAGKSLHHHDVSPDLTARSPSFRQLTRSRDRCSQEQTPRRALHRHEAWDYPPALEAATRSPGDSRSARHRQTADRQRMQAHRR